MGATRFHEYADREALAEGLSAGVAAVLAGGISTRGSAILAVSGGSTPKRFFQRLSKAAIDWARVTVCLVDERWVPEDHPRSNARFLRENLLQDAAAAARVEPYYVPETDAAEGAQLLSPRLSALPGPFDAAILGMGVDGHTASFFPGAERLAEAIDPAARVPVVAIEAPGAGEPRLTLTLPVIAQARFLALHIEGEEKRAVFEEAERDGPVEDLPVRAVLRLSRSEPLQVFWAP